MLLGEPGNGIGNAGRNSDQQTKPRGGMIRLPQYLLGHDGERYFHVEKLSGHRRRGDRQEFWVKWRGYPEAHNA